MNKIINLASTAYIRKSRSSMNVYIRHILWS